MDPESCLYIMSALAPLKYNIITILLFQVHLRGIHILSGALTMSKLFLSLSEKGSTLEGTFCSKMEAMISL